MAEPSQKRGFRAYSAECTLLIYRAFFKPFTLKRWLNTIHRELKSDNNPFVILAESPSNPRLERYAHQVWLLTIIVLPVLMLATLFAYILIIRPRSFSWISIGLILVGWWIGTWPALHQRIRLSGLVIISFLYVLFIIWTFISAFEWLPKSLNYNQIFPQYLSIILQYKQPQIAILSYLFIGFLSGLLFNLSLDWILMIAFGIIVFIISVIFFQSGLTITDYTSNIVGWAIAVGIFCGLFIPVLTRIGVTLMGGIIFVISIVLFNLLFDNVVHFSLFIVEVSVVAFVMLFLGCVRIYLWLPEALWMLILYRLTRKRGVAYWLSYLPQRFDERILLPLPYTSELIEEAYRENAAAAVQTINYLTTSTTQKSVAAQTIRAIIINQFTHCQTVSDITSISDRLYWIPSPAPETLGTLVLQFLELSKSVKAAIESSSLYNRKQLLERSVDTLRHIKLTFGLSGNIEEALAFGNIAEHWLAILETALRNLEEQFNQSGEIPQMYIAGPALDPKLAGSRFKGRTDLFQRIEALSLSNQPPVLLLYGGRRTGKTSVLNHLPRRLGSDLVPLLVDIQGAAAATTLRGFAKELSKQIIESAYQSRGIYLSPPDSNEIDRDPFPALQDWLDQIERDIKKKQLLLCLDEFERLSEVIKVTESYAPLNFLRNIMQYRRRWILLFSGSHMLDELASYWSDYLINTQPVRVSYLEETDARQLISQPEEGFPDIYDTDAVNSIIQLTRCQPYLVQLSCSVLVEYLNREHRLRVAPQDVEAIIPKIFERGGMYFREFWQQNLHLEEQNLLLRLVKGEHRGTNEQAILSKLVQKEILERMDGSYSLQIPLIQKYIETKIIEEM